MLTKLEVRNRQGNLMVLPFEDVDNGLIISEITGLDPTKATLVSSSVAGQDGAQFDSSKREARDITIKMDLEADFSTNTVRSLRQRLYGFFMPKTQVSLRFYEDLGSYVDIQGVIETCDVPLFARDPEATITLQCFDPDFINPDPVTQSGVTVSGSTQDFTPLPYLGSVESGFVFVLNLDRPCNSFTIALQVPNGDTYTLDFAETLLAGDKLTISTISGAKGATLLRNSVLSSLLYGVSPESRWLELEAGPGNNQVRVSASASGIPWTIQYVNRYGGL